MTYPNTVATFPRMSLRTRISTAYGNKLLDEFSVFQTDYRHCIGGFSTLATYLMVARSSTGVWSASGLIYHSNLTGITSGAHHVKLHATSHLGATDPIPLACVTQPGLMASTLASKLTNIITGATRNNVARNNYTGSGGAGRVITLPFQAQSVRLVRDTGSNGTYDIYSWHWRLSVSNPLAERGTNHRGTTAHDIQATSAGFVVTNAANEAGKPYYYVAVG